MTQAWSTAAVTLTIPDNEARTAYSTLRRLGVELAKLERVELMAVPTTDVAALEAAIRQNEALFNENTHRVAMATSVVPGPGELWICEDRPVRVTLKTLGDGVRLRAYRLLDAMGAPATAAVVDDAARLLLCNSAVQRRITNLNDVLAGDMTAR